MAKILKNFMVTEQIEESKVFDMNRMGISVKKAATFRLLLFFSITNSDLYESTSRV